MKPEYMTDEEAQAMLDAPQTVTTLPDGAVRVEKAGIVGVGPTLAEAARDFAGKFAVAFTRPKL